MTGSRDPVIPNEEDSKAIFRRGFLEWSSLVPTAAETSPRVFLDHLRLIETAFPDHPAISNCLRIKENPGSLSVTGSSTWAATIDAPGQDDVPGFQDSHQITVTRFNPKNVLLTREEDVDYSQWFGGQGCQITVLMLAWAYVLSSRWTDLIPGAGPMRYTDSRSNTVPSHDTFTVNLGNVSSDTARWWEAVLAPRQGWLATVSSGPEVLNAPWSIRLPSRPGFSVSYSECAPATGSVATFSTALHYLADYCADYNLADQSRAALAAVLLLPLAASSSSRRIRLPIPREFNIAQQCAREFPRREQSRDICSTSQLDKLLTLSCNTRGLTPILFSLFFDSEVPCNLASPWLQGTFAALDRVSSNTYLLAQTLTNRDPRVGFLWVGAIITGCHTQLLQVARHDGMEVDLLSAMWTNTLQTFIQLPVTGEVRSGRIKREDECRLLYLSSKSYQSYPPLCPWKPFGSTVLEDTDLDVRLHTHCQGHGLRYVGWDWDCWDDGHPTQKAVPACGGAMNTRSKPETNLIMNESSYEIPYEDMDLEEEGPSRMATLNIFMWLRRNGFPSSEQYIRRHAWLCEVLDE